MASPAPTSSRSPDPAAEPGAGTRALPLAAGEAVVVVQRDDFLLELGAALGGQISLTPVETLAEALEPLTSSRRSRLLLIDSRDTADLRADIDRAHAEAPQVPIVVFAPADSEKTVAGALKSSDVFAVLPIPIDARKTAAILEGALADAAAKRGPARGAERPADLRAAFRPSVHSDAAPNAAPDARSAASEGRPPRSMRPFAIAATVVILAAAAAGVLLLRGRTPGHGTSRKSAASAPVVAAPAASVVHPAPPPAAKSSPSPLATAQLVDGTLDTLLEKARHAMRDRRYMSPANDNALVYYLSALKVDPASGEARDGLTRLAGLAVSRFNAAMTAARFDAAATALADLKLAEPQDARLAGLEQTLLKGEIANAFATSDFDRASALVLQASQSRTASAQQIAAWRAELARGKSAARIAHLAALLDASIQAGHLRTPPDASAQSELQQLEALAPGSPAAERGARKLVAADLSRARADALAGRGSDAGRWIAAARGDGMTDAELSDYQRALAQARAQATSQAADKLAELTQARIQSGALLSPAADSADYYLTQLGKVQGRAGAIRALGLELSSSLIEQATAAARAGKIAAMRTDLAAARRWGADPALIAAVRQIAAGPADSAPSGADGTPRIPPGYRPQRIRYVAPQYPQAALDAHESGSVTVEFTVDLDGRPRGVHVVQSKPRGVFDYAAVTAVSRWRFAPPIIDNVPMRIPTRTVIRFLAPR